MKETAPVTKDPICGMTVDKATAIHADRDGETFYFCSDHCRQKFLVNACRDEAGREVCHYEAGREAAG